MVVDGGEWTTDLVNGDQVWSDGASGGINRPGYEPNKAFDGNFDTFFNPEDSQAATLSFTGLTIRNSLRLYCRGDDGNLSVTLGSDPPQQITIDTGPAQWRSANVTGPVSFTSINFAGSQPALYAVEVDGELLVDKGTSGDNKVTGPDTTPGTGTVTSTGANSLTLATFDETFPKRWIANAGKYAIGPEKEVVANIETDRLLVLVHQLQDILVL